MRSAHHAEINSNQEKACLKSTEIRKVQKYGVEAVCDELKKQLVTSYVSVYHVDMLRCDE